jgi:hypothetical protein
VNWTPHGTKQKQDIKQFKSKNPLGKTRREAMQTNHHQLMNHINMIRVEAITDNDQGAKARAGKAALFKTAEHIIAAAADTTQAAKMGLHAPVINMPSKAWLETKLEDKYAKVINNITRAK